MRNTVPVIFSVLFLWALSSMAAEKCRKLGEIGITPIHQAHLHKDIGFYVKGMEKSSLQKAAYASLARPGLIVDLGTGSGVSAYDLAILYPDSQIIGVDLDPKMIEYATQHYKAPNLRYMVGDAEKDIFPPGTVDTIFMSSTGHHLTSYGTGDFDVQHVRNAITSAYRQLKPGGLYINRDFLISDGPKNVILDLPVQDGTAALFERFAQDFRSSVHPRSGVDYKEVEAPKIREGWRRFLVSYRDAVEFVLRKDYRESYDAEIKEEYTYLNQGGFEDAVRSVGFRSLLSAPIYNPWIVQNRFRGKFTITDPQTGTEVPLPATNYVIAGEKIGEGEGQRIVEESHVAVQNPKFLRIKTMRRSGTQDIFDVVERPNETTDVIPYFKRKGQIYILGKQAFPRPILTTLQESENLTGARGDGYVAEPISAIRSTSEGTFAALENRLERQAGISPKDILKAGPGRNYQFYVSPGLVNERVTSVAIPIKSRPLTITRPAENYSGLSSSGVVRPTEATQLLRAGQAGSILDSRMEIGVYNLLLDQNLSVGPWIGEEVSLANSLIQPPTSPASRALNPPRKHRAFEATESNQFGRFLEVREGKFNEVDKDGNVIATTTREYVLPKTLSTSVLSAIPVYKAKGKIYVGLETRQLPSVQINEGTSDITTNPAWRLPKEVTDTDHAVEFAVEGLRKNFKTEVIKTHTLGGPYNPSPGVTAETVHPFAFEVDPRSVKDSSLTWVSLEDLVNQRASIRDGHLFLATLRLAHALGLLY